MTAPATSYDKILYPNTPHNQTHPARTAATAWLFGVPAASPTRCRVLELGGGAGGNLIPLAVSYPESEFVGVDYAPTPVAAGNETVAALGLKNIRLIAADVRAVGDDLGAFDYVVAHGLFSWVPEEARLAVLDLCRRVLAPAGVAYVSYNAFPGCRSRQILWEMARYHTADIDDPAEKIRQARAAYQFLSEGVTWKSPLKDHVRDEARTIAHREHDALIFHDDLSASNQPFYFHEFMALAGRYGLAFLAEALHADMVNDVFPPGVAGRLDQLGEIDVIREEQYRDFLQLRRFRQTLLVREGVPVGRPPTPDRLRSLWLSVETVPDQTAPDLAPGVPVRFQVKTGAALTTDDAVSKAALLALARRCPHPIHFDDLIVAAEVLLGRAAGQTTEAERADVAEVLLQAFRAGMVFAFVDPPRTAPTAPDRPRLSPVVRHQIETGADSLTSLLHTVVRIDDPIARRLLWLLDGTRDKAAVTADLAEWAAAEAAKAATGPAPTADALRAQYATRIDAGFAKAAELALLVP